MRRLLLLTFLCLLPGGTASAAPFAIGDASSSSPVLASDPRTGEGHLLWRTADQRMSYCHLARGATACDRPVDFQVPSSAGAAFDILRGEGRTVYAVFFTDGATYLSTSPDAGATWDDASADPGLQPRKIYGRSAPEAFRERVDYSPGRHELIVGGRGGQVFGAKVDGSEASVSDASSLYDIYGDPGSNVGAGADDSLFLLQGGPTEQVRTLAPGKDPVINANWSAPSPFTRAYYTRSRSSLHGAAVVEGRNLYRYGSGFSAPVMLPDYAQQHAVSDSGHVLGLLVFDGLRVERVLEGSDQVVAPELVAAPAAGESITTSNDVTVADDGGGWVAYETSTGTGAPTLHAVEIPAVDPPDPGPTVTPTPTASTSGAIAGTVTDPKGAPLPRSIIEACPPLPQRCRTTSINAGGAYRIAPLAPGSYTVRVSPVGVNYASQSTSALVRAGADVTLDFSLEPARGLTGGLSVDTGGGPQRDGPPVVSWAQPFSFSAPVEIDQHSTPDSDRIYTAMLRLAGVGDTGGPAVVNTAEVVMIAVHYDHDGKPEAISNLLDGVGTPQLVRRVQRSTRGLTDGCGPGIRLDPTEKGLRLTIGDETGFFDLHLDINPIELQPPDDARDRLHHVLNFPANVLVHGANGLIEEIPGVGTYNNGIRALATGLDLRRGNYRRALKRLFVSFGVPPLAKTYALPFHGPLQYVVTEEAATVLEKAADGVTTTDVACDSKGGSLYIDPSGTVTTSKDVPLAAATVTLRRADDATSPLTVVPDGSPIMSPSNRVNPDKTDRTGFFRWDTIAGFYTVEARHKGCATKSTDRLPVPPPQVDLRIRLECKHPPKRIATRTKLRRVGRTRYYAITVRGKRKPRGVTGLVTLTAGRQAVAQLPLRDHGRQLVAVPKGASGRLRARYAGDGLYAPSGS